MRTSVAALGKHFGNLGKNYGEYRFAIAPNEQKAFKGFVDQAFVRTFKSYVVDQWHYYIPQTIGAYLIYDWAIKENHKLSKKDPAQYANDV
uniref:Cytochrome b-c1 complex subunit 8 n=1 Tax=Rhabditophanes sp. KR3021 TaxID=114890 RepID=A0AC35TVW2_9BILA